MLIFYIFVYLFIFQKTDTVVELVVHQVTIILY